jgi:hypothetical protein
MRTCSLVNEISIHILAVPSVMRKWYRVTS